MRWTLRRGSPTRAWPSIAGRWVAAGVLVATGGVVLAGCASARNDLGTGNSGCYVAIPAAVDSVHVHLHLPLHGVRLYSVSNLRAVAPALYRAARERAPGVRQVCLVAFTGHFTSSEVTDPVGGSRGVLAVVELTYPDHRVLATFIAERVPVRFGHVVPF